MYARMRLYIKLPEILCISFCTTHATAFLSSSYRQTFSENSHILFRKSQSVETWKSKMFRKTILTYCLCEIKTTKQRPLVSCVHTYYINSISYCKCTMHIIITQLKFCAFSCNTSRDLSIKNFRNSRTPPPVRRFPQKVGRYHFILMYN